MLSKNARKIILRTSVALSVALTSTSVPGYFNETYQVEAATVVNQTQGEVTITISSLWTYSKADWAARSKVYVSGDKFTVLEKLSVDGREMYKLSNGLFITANPQYVSFKASASTPVVNYSTKSVTTVNLNMRSGAGTGYGIILTIPKNAEVILLSNMSGWSKVTYNGRTGYVSSAYLTGTAVSTPVITPIASAPAPTAPSSTSVTKTNANLNMRKGAGTGYGIILTIPKDKIVTVLSSANGWTKVTYNGSTGYVSSSYLVTTQSNTPVIVAPVTPEVPSTPSTTSVTKTNANLNMRKGAGTGYGIILTIPKDKVVTVLSSANGWTKVTYNGSTGYVSSSYLVTTQSSTPVVPTTPVVPVVPTAPSGTITITKTQFNLNMRKGAGTGYGIILTIPKDKEVTVLSSANGWTKVTYNGSTGYVSSQYLISTTTVVTPPPVVVEPPVITEPPVVVALPSVLNLDNLKPSYDNVDIALTGYAVHNSGIKTVTATLDGNDLAISREERADVKTLFSNYANTDNAGFKLNISKLGLSVGKHNLVIKTLANDGTVKSNTYNFNLAKPAPAISIHGVTDGQAVPTGTLNLSGFAVNIEGVAGVKYYVNGTAYTNISYNLASTETGAYSGYTGYQNGNFTFNVDSALLNKPVNSIKVELTGKDGTVYGESVVLRGAGSERYSVENYSRSLDEYVNLEIAKLGLAKGAATSNSVKTSMDAANYVYDDANRFIFMDLSYVADSYKITAENLNKVLVNEGVLKNQGQAFLDGANTYGVNPYYLIAHAILETGHGNSVLANGQVVTDTYTKFGDKSTIVVGGNPVVPVGTIVYNVFGIGAYDSDANLWGKQKAYSEGWFTVEDAIKGGAKWISTNYINRSGNNQNTLYKMRFNLAADTYHEYATDLGWAVKQANRIKLEFEKMSVDMNLVKFIYPTYED
ncbi:MAG: SH3 domain-containing protein [Clostridiaceae bacterium]